MAHSFAAPSPPPSAWPGPSHALRRPTTSAPTSIPRSGLSSAVRSQRHAEKDLARLAASVRGAAKWPALVGTAASAAQIEVSGVLAEAVVAAVVFSAVECVSAAATTAAASRSNKTTAASLISLVKKNRQSAASDEKEMVALERLEECIAEMESGSDKVFRSVLRTRVALLNIHTRTC